MTTRRTKRAPEPEPTYDEIIQTAIVQRRRALDELDQELEYLKATGEDKIGRRFECSILTAERLRKAGAR